MANFSEPYSILNPDTNSDSPSAKSNGVRLSSATTVISQIPAIIIAGSKYPTICPLTKNLINDILFHIRAILKRIKANEISYEIVCAAARRPPIKAYFLFDAQPDPSNG